MKLLVGLGNPGREYVGTRHNVGYDVVDAVAHRLGLVDSPDGFNRKARSNFDGLAMDCVATVGGTTEKVLLLKPTTFMNLSGKAVQSAMAFYQLAPTDILVALDDMALPCGRIRLRAGGSSGGHNGLRDIERALGSADYPRLRIGIDAPVGRVPWKDYVLTRFSESQRPLVAEAVDRAAMATLKWIGAGIGPAMTEYNVKDDR